LGSNQISGGHLFKCYFSIFPPYINVTMPLQDVHHGSPGPPAAGDWCSTGPFVRTVQPGSFSHLRGPFMYSSHHACSSILCYRAQQYSI